MFRTSQRIVVSILLTIVVVNAIRAQDREVAKQFDPTVTVDIDAGRFRFDVYTGREKSEELEAGNTNIGAGVSFRVKPIFKSFLDSFDTDKQHVFVVRLGYEYSRAGEDDEESHTHSLMTDGTLRYAFPKKVLMSDRNRFELRSVDDESSFRYRNRLQFERPVKIFRRKITPYGSAEAYWDGRFRSWNKFRYSGGAEVSLFWRMSIDISYTRERCVTCADPHTDILGANLHIFLKLKK